MLAMNFHISKMVRSAILCASVAIFSPVLTAAIVVSDPSYADAVACSHRVSALSDEHNRLLTEHQSLDNQCAQSLAYYHKMIGYVDTSIKHLENQKASRDSDAKLKKMYTERYSGLMCAKSYEAFFLNDADARLEINHICMGRDSLAPRALLHHRALRCPQADSMQKKVDALRSAKAAKAAECRARKRELRTELAEKRAKEDELQDQHFGSHSSKAAVRSKAAAEVEGKWCKVIQANYRFNEGAIRAYWKNNCQ